MNHLEEITREIEFYDKYAAKLRQQIEAAQWELARITRLKQQKRAELARLKAVRRVRTIKEVMAV